MSKGLLGILWLALLATKNCAADLCENELDGSRIPHPDDCGSFIVCRGSVEDFIGNCPKGLHFNPILKDCDLKTRAGCMSSDFKQAARSYGFAGFMPCCDCSACSKCSNDFTFCEGRLDGSLLQYPGDCTKYIRCENECATIRKCPDGQLWNPKIRCCDAACNVDCPGYVQPPKVCQNGLTYCKGKPDYSVLQYPGDCSKYIHCYDQCATVQQCSNGQLWNPKIQCCDEACNVDCPGYVQPPKICPNGLTYCQGKPNYSVLQYTGDCSKYIRCYDQCATVQQCPNGQLWNPKIQCCDEACNVDCPGYVQPPKICSNGLTYCQGKPNYAVLQYPSDCSKYIRCYDQCATVQQCPNGQLWNPKIQCCDEACNVDCPGYVQPPKICPNGLTYCQGKPNYSVLQYTGDCSKYIRCYDQCATVQQCPNGQLWNPKIQCCDEACNVDCPGYVQPPKICSNGLTYCQGKPNYAVIQYPSDCSKYIRCYDQCATVQQCPTGQLWNPKIQSCDEACNVDCPGYVQPPKICPNGLTYCQGKPDYSVIQYPGDCSKYIRCNDQCGTVQQCPSGQLWNPKIQCCDEACNVDCPGYVQPPKICPNGLTYCQGKPDYSILQYPGDCSKYIRCNDQCATVQQCPDGQLWNPKIQCCDTACNVDCLGYVQPPKICPNGLTYCQGKPDNLILQYPGDCSKYIRCNDQCANVLQCPNGELWNPHTQYCDAACNVDCPSQNNPSPTSPPNPPSPTGPSGHSCNSPGKCRGQPDGKMFKDDYSNGYIVCQCECEIQQSCPPGLVYKESLGICDWPTQNDGSPIACPPGLVYNPQIGVCDWPSQNDNSPVACPPGLVYNPQIGCCDYPPPDEGCGDNSPSPAPPTPPAPPAPPAPAAPTGPSGIACASGGRCANRVDGVMLPSTDSCNKYVVCQCGCEVEMSCPATLHYDAARNTCNYPDLANCRI